MDEFLDKLSDAPEDDFPVNIHDGKFLSGRLNRLREIEGLSYMHYDAAK